MEFNPEDESQFTPEILTTKNGQFKIIASLANFLIYLAEFSQKAYEILPKNKINFNERALGMIQLIKVSIDLV